jgi:hypothetical protein
MLYNMACSSSDEIETLCELMRRKCSNIKTDISDTDVNCDRNTCQSSHSHQTENPCQHVESLSVTATTSHIIQHTMNGYYYKPLVFLLNTHQCDYY